MIVSRQDPKDCESYGSGVVMSSEVYPCSLSHTKGTCVIVQIRWTPRYLWRTIEACGRPVIKFSNQFVRQSLDNSLDSLSTWYHHLWTCFWVGWVEALQVRHAIEQLFRSRTHVIWNKSSNQVFSSRNQILFYDGHNLFESWGLRTLITFLERDVKWILNP